MLIIRSCRMRMGKLILLDRIAAKRKIFLVNVHYYENCIITICNDLLLYAVTPVTIVVCNLKYTGKSTRLQMQGHYILSNTILWHFIPYQAGCHPLNVVPLLSALTILYQSPENTGHNNSLCLFQIYPSVY